MAARGKMIIPNALVAKPAKMEFVLLVVPTNVQHPGQNNIVALLVIKPVATMIMIPV